VLEAFHKCHREKPTCFICYTVKGFGLPFAGHKDNHAGLMTPAQMETFRQAMGVRAGYEWDKFEGLTLPAEQLQSFLDHVPFASAGARRFSAPDSTCPTACRSQSNP
jgi:pyruvate dehydrogenase E1 component